MTGHNAVAVANEILDTAARKGISISPMQLQKLLYFCHGWNLEVRGEPLIADNFQAWQYGPVHPAVYRAFRHYGSANITRPAHSDFRPLPLKADISEAERQLIDEVVNLYGGLSGPQMSNLTHRPGTPWSDVWDGGLGKNDPIANERIQNEFQRLRERTAA